MNRSGMEKGSSSGLDEPLPSSCRQPDGGFGCGWNVNTSRAIAGASSSKCTALVVSIDQQHALVHARVGGGLERRCFGGKPPFSGTGLLVDSGRITRPNRPKQAAGRGRQTMVRYESFRWRHLASGGSGPHVGSRRLRVPHHRRRGRALRTSGVKPGDGTNRSRTMGKENDPGKRAVNRRDSAFLLATTDTGLPATSESARTPCSTS